MTGVQTCALPISLVCRQGCRRYGNNLFAKSSYVNKLSKPLPKAFKIVNILERRGTVRRVFHFSIGITLTVTSKLKLYLAELRAPFFTATIVPVALGAAIGWARTGAFFWGWFVLTMAGGILLHAGANVSNDYFDHKSGCDEANEEFARPFTGGSRLIQEGLLSPREVLGEALVAYALAAAIGLYFIIVRGPAILLLGVIGAFSGFFYTAPPFKLVHRGVGEIFIGLNFGVLLTLGSYFVQTGTFAVEPAVASLPVAFLITAVLYINEFQDYNADKSVGKNHWVIRLGKKRATRGFAIIMLLVYLSIVAGVVIKMLTPWALAALFTAPLALKAVRVAIKNYGDSQALIPANAATIGAHLTTGLALTLAYVIQGFF